MIEISDNGIGRAKASEIKSKDGNKHKSYGISLTEERLKLMQKIKGITTRVVIEDLYDDRHQSSGTKVILYIHM
jgi:sensor histidine kinase YesM